MFIAKSLMTPKNRGELE